VPRAFALRAFALLLALGGAVASWIWARGYTLYYGDAEAHLNIARRILDSRTPGPEQIGTVWLPLPHLLWATLAWIDPLWRNGLAGVIPTVVCFALAGTFLCAAAWRAYGCGHAAAAAALLFALNPNMLFLQAAPMTEAVFAAALAALLWATLKFHKEHSLGAVLAAAAASNAASLTRYEGWFLIPFTVLYLLWIAKRKHYAMLFAALAALGPLAWLAHNQFWYGDALEFYNGPYSAIAIYQRQLARGMKPHPGNQDWSAALAYYYAAMKHVLGSPLLYAGAAGAVTALFRKAWWPLLLFALPGAFYVWSIHSGSTPVFVPELEPFTRYNTRYALALLPLVAIAAGALVTLLPGRFHIPASALAGVAAAAAWIGGNSICWEEAAAGWAERRAWTAGAAKYLAANYRPGSGILFTFGDLTTVLRLAGIPLREGLYQDNTEAWKSAVANPDRDLHEEWVLAQPGDAVSGAMLRAGRYRLVWQVGPKGEPAVNIYRRL
jgi:hypothetical protein